MIGMAALLAAILAARADAAPPAGTTVRVRAATEPARGAAVAPARAPRSPDRPGARSGEAAVREELDAARRAGTRAAYDLFLSRHPDHPLAGAAQEERGRLR